jgi:hypothetical protein
MEPTMKRFILLAALLFATVAQTVAIPSHSVLPQAVVMVACNSSDC